MYRHYRSLLWEARTAEEARQAMREYAAEPLKNDDEDRLLMLQYVQTICNLNQTDWFKEFVD